MSSPDLRPPMPSGRWSELKECFHRALDLSPEERRRELQDLERVDPELARDLESLLEAHDGAGDPLGALVSGAAELVTTEVMDRAGAAPAPPSPFPRRELAPGTVVARRYRLVRLLGRGGMGEVHAAEDLVLSTAVALKTLHAAADQEGFARFRREALTARRVTHPNVCRVYDVGIDEERGLPFLTMELLEGEALQDRIAREGSLPADEVLALARQLAAGLDAAHAAGIVHRDFKPGNVILTAGPRPVVTDFGLARSHAEGDPLALRITGAAVAGTPAYMAPEQVRGEPSGPAADVYAFGVVLFELLTGELPFTADSPLAAAAKRLVESPPSLRHRAPHLDPRWEEVVNRCLSLEPERRFAGAGDAVAALEGRGPLRHPIAPPAPALPGSLPMPRTRFVGRAREKADVLGLLSRCRLVTIVGAGGAGKTRLALEIASASRSAWTDGVWLVDLAGLAAGADVASVVAGAMGISEDRSRAGGAALASALAAKRLLLLLDNCERSAAACAALVTSLLPEAPAVSVLATSRTALGAPGEEVLRLDPLAPTDAVALFTQRAREVQPGFELTTASVGTVEEIAKRLDYIPLAIELAAARVRAMPAEQILKRLKDRFRLLTIEGAEGHAHHRTLRAAIAWSWDQLSAPSQTLLARLSVFAGGFGLEAAEHVGAPLEDAEILDVLTSLIDGSLVSYGERAGEARYHLMESVRAFGLEMLRAAGEEASVMDRHLGYFVRLASEAAEGLRGPGQAALLARLDTERHDLSAACDWSLASPDRGAGAVQIATAVTTFWEIRGHLTEGRARLAACLASPSGAEKGAARCRLLQGAAVLARRQGDLELAVQLAEEARTLAVQCGDAPAEATALHALGVVAADRGDRDASLACLRESLSKWRQLGDRRGLASVLLAAGIQEWERDDPRAALAHYEESRALFAELGDRRGEASCLNNVAIVAYDARELARSRALHEEALAIRRELGDRRGMAASLDNLGVLASAVGDHDRARAMKEESLSILRELGDRTGAAVTLASLGDTARHEGDFARARALFEESIALARDVRNTRAGLQALEGIGLLALAEGRWAMAVKLHAATLALREKNGILLADGERAARLAALGTARDALGVGPFDALWAEGAVLDFPRTADQALAREHARPGGP